MNKTWQSLILFSLLAVLTGLAYPAFITLAAHIFFKEKAEGSLIYKDGQLIGSKLIAQKFSLPEFFWPRPSAINYNPLPSGGSNRGETSGKLLLEVQDRIKKLGAHANKPPADLVYASGSGLDPHISIESAYFQMDRVLKSRKNLSLKSADLEKLIHESLEGSTFFGSKYVNVLILNLLLEERFPHGK